MFDRDTLNRLYRYSRSLCEQDSDAFDLLQSALERCVRTPPRDPAAAVSYAMKVIRNLFVDQCRSDARVSLEPFDEHGSALDFDLSGLESLMMDRSELELAWAELSVVEREILYLWAVEGYSTNEVAGHLDRPRNTVLSIIHRMRQRLKHRFGDERTTG
jgi:RNA polymerase sigma-70 factor (ECF subfamily)